MLHIYFNGSRIDVPVQKHVSSSVDGIDGITISDVRKIDQNSREYSAKQAKFSRKMTIGTPTGIIELELLATNQAALKIMEDTE